MADEPAIVGERGRLSELNLRKAAVLRIDDDTSLAGYNYARHQGYCGVVSSHHVECNGLCHRILDRVVPTAGQFAGGNLTTGNRARNKDLGKRFFAGQTHQMYKTFKDTKRSSFRCVDCGDSFAIPPAAIEFGAFAA